MDLLILCYHNSGTFWVRVGIIGSMPEWVITHDPEATTQDWTTGYQARRGTVSAFWGLFATYILHTPF